MCVIRRIQTFFDDIDEWGLPDGSSFFVRKFYPRGEDRSDIFRCSIIWKSAVSFLGRYNAAVISSVELPFLDGDVAS